MTGAATADGTDSDHTGSKGNASTAVPHNTPGAKSKGGPKKAPAPGCSLEAENDLLQFLKVVRPGWSIPRRGSQSDIQRVMHKLKTIGVSDTDELIRRVTQNTINDDFFATGQSRFGRSTLDDMRKQMPFIKALNNMNKPCCRMTGKFAPVPQLLSKTNLRARLPTVSMGGSTSSGNPGSASGSMRRTLSDTGFSRGSPSVSRTLDFNTSEPGSPSPLSDRPFFRERLRLRDADQGRRRRMVGAMSVPDLSHQNTGSTCELLSASCLDDVSQPSPSAGRSNGERTAMSPGSARGAKCKSSSPQRPRVESSALSATPSNRGANIAKSRNNTMDQTRGDDAGSNSSPHPSPTIKFALNTEVVSPPASPIGEVEALSRSGWNPSMGGSMRGSDNIARWAIGGVKNAPLMHSEEMLREQICLDDRERLARLIRPSISPMRAHIASNIRNRLKEESERDAMEVLNIQQRCINIRKNLTGMSNTRRELSAIRGKVQLLVEGEPEEEAMKVALTLDKWSSSKRNTNHDLGPEKPDMAARGRAHTVESLDLVEKEVAPGSKTRLSPGAASRHNNVGADRGATKSPRPRSKTCG